MPASTLHGRSAPVLVQEQPDWHIDGDTTDHLLGLSDEQLTTMDVAEINLQCAVGLPGSERLDVSREQRIVDQWARLVAEETLRQLPRFRKRPEQYDHSEPFFRMLVLSSTLQLKCGVKYNLATLEGEIDYTDSRQHFIHGILEGFGGTCVTLPVLYAAVGRRLRYPLKLVTSVGHLFCRWDDPQAGVRLNLEVSGRGLGTPSDDECRQWPKVMSPQAEQAYCYLKSFTRRQELAEFYAIRAHCYLDGADFSESFRFFHAAMQFWPENLLWEQNAMVAGVLWRESAGQVLYGLLGELPLPEGFAWDHGRRRSLKPWEEFGVFNARQHLRRLAENRERRRRRRLENAPETVFPDYSSVQGQAR